MSRVPQALDCQVDDPLAGPIVTVAAKAGVLCLWCSDPPAGLTGRQRRGMRLRLQRREGRF